jgi:ribosomal protein L37E
VPATLHVQEPPPFRHSQVTAPNWQLVPFDVGCARCGHDLRGLTEPKCPSCGLEFEWSQAVPIEQLICRKCGYHLYGLTETRCPECGQPFTWTEVLDDYHRKRKPLFEYHWRDRPFRSLAYTWWLALRPRTLWRIIDIHDPPQLRPLAVMGAIALFLLALGSPICMGMSLWLIYSVCWPASGAPTAASIADLPSYLWTQLCEVTYYEAVIPVAALWAIGLGALLILRQSMRRARVRNIHVVRVWAYSVIPIVPTALLAFWVCFLPIFLLEATSSTWSVTRAWGDTATIVVGCSFLYAAWSIRQGYRHYLRIPHSIAVAVLSQIIAVLATMAFGALFAAL